MLKTTTLRKNFCLLFFLTIIGTLNAQFVHPGLSHKQSDLDRMKYMVEAEIEPWSTSFEYLRSNSDASANYNVFGPTFNDPAGTTYINNSLNAMQKDAQAAYYNAIVFYITGEEEHAQKAVEIFNAWSTIRNIEGVIPLNVGKPLWRMLEAAEIIKATYSGWSDNDINAFKEMLVYPGFSGSNVPSGDTSFYWHIYNGDPARHGNQGLFAFRSVMAIGVFLDNEIIYNRALRYLQGMEHASNDLPYPSGPPITTPSPGTSNEYYNEFTILEFDDAIADYGYNELIENYIWETGQSQESSRDQAHAIGGISIIATMCEIAWNQGDDLYGFLDNRVLKGLEYTYRYNISFSNSFPDQPSPWEPTIASGEFIRRTDRSGRWESLKINPYIGNNINDDAFLTRGKHIDIPLPQMVLGHYKDRIKLNENDYKWLERADELAFLERGYERNGTYTDHPSYGHLTFHRVEGSPGDPIKGFTSGIPNYGIHQVPGTIEAEHYDYFQLNGNGKTYFDNSSGNSGNEYRTDEDVDIETCSEGGYNIGFLDNGEWLTYTVQVAATGTYDITIRYAGMSANGNVQFDIDNEDKTGIVSLPSTGGSQQWQTFTVKEGVILSKGVHNIKINIGGARHAFNLNNFSILTSNACAASQNISSSNLVSGINYRYYEGIWDLLPDFDALTPISEGLATGINLNDAESTDYFGFTFEGYINIANEGNYTFYTSSDDGSNLYIDDVKIVDNDGTHGVQEKSGSICLEEGYHKIKVTYFEKTGGNSLSVSYAGPNFSKTILTNVFAISETPLLDQTITFPNIASKQIGDPDFSPGATASSGLAVSYTSANTDVATIINGNIHITGTGTSTITASQPGNTAYNPAPNVSRTLTVTSNTNGENLALNGIATQSSIDYQGAPSRAIDGNTNGNWSGGSITHTANENNPWWQVDLGVNYTIDDIIIFNRTDSCCADRLTYFTVSVINTNGATTFSQSYAEYPNPSLTVNANGAIGSIIKIQLNSTNPLSLAEVEVYGEEIINQEVVDFQLVKRNATGFAIDGGSGAVEGRSLELYPYVNHPNLTWTEIDRGNGYYSYQKLDTSLCMDGGDGGKDGQDIVLSPCTESDHNQHWLKIDAGNGHYRLQKRNAPQYAIDGGNGGNIDQKVYLWSSNSNNQNQQWLFTSVDSKNTNLDQYVTNQINVTPNPLNATNAHVLKINISGSSLARVDILNIAGQLIRSQNIYQGNGSLQLHDLNEAIYIVKITTEEQSYVKKISVQK